MNRILIVEDEPAISNLIQMNLAAAGYCCVCAFDGAKAADRLELERFDSSGYHAAGDRRL